MPDSHGQTMQFAELLVYILAARLMLRFLRGILRDVLFTSLNVGAFFLFYFYGKGGRYPVAFAAYVGLAVIQYLTLRLFAEKKGWLPWLAFWTPLLALILIRYGPASLPALSGGFLAYGSLFVGLSYLAFRCSLLVLEVRNGSVRPPGFFNYLGFCFFLPTMAVGPINPYGKYGQAFQSKPPVLDIGRSALRILVGLVKYRFLGGIFFQLTYTNLLLDDHYHLWIDLPVAMVFYYFFLYCNFSGFCDMAIGAAGLIGVPVAENFNDPFAARNVKDFWNRWHITLSQYMRDVVFTPLSKTLVRITGPGFLDHDIAITITVVFLLVGIWHGVGWNYALFGLAHAFALVVHHYYSIALKKWLGRDGFRAYSLNPWIHKVAVAITFCYCAAALFLFANTVPEMKQIFSVLK